VVYVVTLKGGKTRCREEVLAPDISSAIELAREKFGERIVKCERRFGLDDGGSCHKNQSDN
jgi:hypothetical protein